MSTMNAESSTSAQSVKSSSLTRGKACITCRRKKMRCDGLRPYCTPCSLTRRPFDCEYTDKQGRTFTEVLEERLRLLKIRIRELEGMPKDGGPVWLHDPYANSISRERERTKSPAMLIEPFDFAVDSCSPLPDFGPSESGNLYPPGSYESLGNPSSISQQPPLEFEPDLKTLLQLFSEHAPSLHFSLWIPPLIRSLNSVENAPSGSDTPSNPHECLTSSISLWSLLLSFPEPSPLSYPTPTAPFMDQDTIDDRILYHLNRATEALPSAMSHHHIQYIQASLLLALYFIYEGRVLEGNFHLGAAASAALACGLHRISVSPTSYLSSSAPMSLLPGIGGGLGIGGPGLEPPQNALSLVERINLFWSIYALDRCWSVALGRPPSILDSDHPSKGVPITTPLPLFDKTLETYEKMSLEEFKLSFPSVPSISNFAESGFDYSTLALSTSTNLAIVIASKLFERATRLIGSQGSNDDGDDTDAHPELEEEFLQEVEKLSISISNFNNALRSQSTGINSRSDDRLVLLAKSIGYAAVIQLYYPLSYSRPSEEAEERYHHAIREIVSLIRNDMALSLGEMEKFDFFIGIVWLSAARVILIEAALLSSNTSSMPPSPSRISFAEPSTSTEPQLAQSIAPAEATQDLIQLTRIKEVADDLETLLGAIRALARRCPLIYSQLEAFEELRQA